MEEKRPTLKDVAERSGYALRTVKKVMNGKETVREKTREGVLRAAEELHYTRNLAASALARNRRIRVAVVYTQTTEAYFPEIERGFRQCQADLADYGLELEFRITTQPGWEHQKELLDGLLERDDIQGILLQPYSAAKLDETIDRLVRGGKPVITFGSDAPGSKRLCYVGPNAYQSGRIGAQILANYIGKKGTVFLVSLGCDHMQTRERCRGFRDRVAEFYPDIRVFEMNLPENAGLYHDMLCSVIRNENVSGLFCTDANTGVAGRLLKELGTRGIALVGFDLSEESVRLMKEGYIKVIIDQKPSHVSHLALKLMFQYLVQGTRPTPIQHTQLYITTSECLVDSESPS